MITHPVLSRLATKGVKLGLERVESFLQFLGEPHRAYPVVHVAGTNGKGSVCAMVTAALVDAGYRVGTYTSPHVEAVNERVALNGIPIDDQSLVEAIGSLERARVEWAESQRLETLSLTYYEFMTILAFRYFAAMQVDVAVVEVGLGGRLDATNVVDSVVTAITTIGYDHMDVLGNTLGEIAGEKAGICKRGVPLAVGWLPPEALEVIARRAAALGCPMWRPGPEIQREYRRGGWAYRTPESTISGISPALGGLHQGSNAAVAVAILHMLRRLGFLAPDDAIRSGISRAYVPGRLEELLPGLLIDGAHNVAGAEALARYLEDQERPGTRILLWGMGSGRDPGRIIEPLLPHFDEVVTTRCAHPKARDPVELASYLDEHLAGGPVLSAGLEIDEILAEVYADADETVVAGSLYLAGAVRSLVEAGVLDGIEPGQGSGEADDADADQ